MNNMCFFDVGFLNEGNSFFPYVLNASAYASFVSPYEYQN